MQTGRLIYYECMRTRDYDYGVAPGNCVREVGYRILTSISSVIARWCQLLFVADFCEVNPRISQHSRTIHGSRRTAC